MPRLRIAVVGVGPRGLSAFERIVSHVRATRVETDVLLVEPGELGVGVHRRDQPPYLLLNTVAGQATAFSDEQMVPAAPITSGPSLMAWCHARGVTVAGCGGTPAARQVDYDDFLPRSVFGDYLAWAAEQLLDDAPREARVTLARQTAVNVRPSADGAEVLLEDGTLWSCDLAVVATGHGLPSPVVAAGVDAEIVDCFPLPASVAGIPPGAEIAIEGGGLTAVDVIAALTVGRGGRYVVEDRMLRYDPCGREPRLLILTRTGWLPCARPAHPRQVPASNGRHLTLAAVEALRAQHPEGLLDFHGDLAPLLREEVLGDDLDAEARAAAERILHIVPERWKSYAAYCEAVLRQTRWDLEQARDGLGCSAFKERMESLRDHREVLRSAVDPPGFTANGHRAFFDVVPALANRAAVGPEPARMAELLALIDAGVLRLGPGPAPHLRRGDGGWLIESSALECPQRERVELLVRAHLHWPRPSDPGDPLGAALRTWAMPHPHDSQALALTRENKLRTRAGVVSAIAVIGPPAEGASYYNNYILWPRVWSRVLTDLDRVIAPLFQQTQTMAPRVDLP